MTILIKHLTLLEQYNYLHTSAKRQINLKERKVIREIKKIQTYDLIKKSLQQ